MNRSSFYASMGLGVLLAVASFYPTTAGAVRTRGGAHSSVNHGGGGHHASGNRSGGGNRNVSNAHNNNRNTNVNRNTNINSNRNVNVNVDSDRGWNDHYDHYHPVATAAAVTATVAVTSAVVGSIVNSPPSSGCVQTIQGGVSYTQCGSTWYQPQYSGSQVNYVVVNPPY